MFSIRYKIFLIVIPLLIVSLIILTIVSIGFARNGINKVAKEFLGYKINEIIQKTNNSIDDVKKLGLYNDEMIESIKNNIEEYATSITRKDESVLAIDSKGIVKLSTDPLLKKGDEIKFFDKLRNSDKDWISYEINNVQKVGYYSYFKEWDMYFLLSVYSKFFIKMQIKSLKIP